MKVFISGGAKNGKSTFAEDLAIKLSAEGNGPLYYIATMVPSDQEDRERILRHRNNRQGKGFITIERHRDISGLLDMAAADGTFLLDSVTALLSNVMFPKLERESSQDGTWEENSHNEESFAFDERAGEKVGEDLIRFSEGVKNIIFVSDYIYSEAKEFDQWTEAYRRALAHVDKALAAACHQVIEISAGIPTFHKGGPEENRRWRGDNSEK